MLPVPGRRIQIMGSIIPIFLIRIVT